MEPFANRVEKLTEALRSEGLACMALLPSANLLYLTGIHKSQSERPIVAFFPAAGEPHWVIPMLEADAVRQALPHDASFHAYSDEEGYEEAFRDAAAGLGRAEGVIGIDPRAMRVLEATRIEAIMGRELRDAGGLLAAMRAIKEPREIEAMREAIRITEAALAATLVRVESGMTERQVQNLLYGEMLGVGCEDMPFGALVVSGPRAALAHASAGERLLKPGDTLIFDCGVRSGGYAADITRTFFVGHADPEMTRIYEIVAEANAAGRAAATPGVPAEDVDRATRDVITRAGYGEHFIHRTGHGLGLEVHEPPYIVAGNQTLLQEGMTFTVEPGIYLPGKGGVRIEDDVRITADGRESLTGFSRALKVLG